MKGRSALVALSESQIGLILDLLTIIEITVPRERYVRIADDVRHIAEQCRVALMAIAGAGVSEPHARMRVGPRTLVEIQVIGEPLTPELVDRLAGYLELMRRALD